MPARAVALSVVAGLFGLACSLPPLDLEATKPLALRSRIVASDGSLLARLGGTRLNNLYCENRAPISIDDVPQTLIDAVIAAEDDSFFEHEGFDLGSIARAALVNAREGRVVQGGSTITQQYVKNTYFRDPGKTFERKARELRLALEVERRYSKEEILERYLNTVYFGSGAYGVKVASETYFGHGVRKLRLSKAALLAALIKAPSQFDPRRRPRAARERRNYVIERMTLLGKIGARRARLARRAPLAVTGEVPHIATREPYFVEAVKRELLADRRLGASVGARTKSLCRGGLRVQTTLEPSLQRSAEQAVADVLDQPGDPSAALVAIEPATGNIVAMVGGRRWESSQVNLALGRAGGGSGRQPGSSFKPIVLAAALESGIPLAARYESSPAVFTFPGSEPWSVRNAEGRGYGRMRLDEAMVRSVNGVYARLGLDLGPPQMATQARLMGVRSKLRRVPSLALGAVEVSVLDMAAAYASLANEGTAIEPTTIEQIRLPSSEVLRPDQERVESAMSAGNAWLITKVLQQVIKRGTGRAADIGRPAAGKTGTTNSYTDAWFVGYTPQLVTAVWVGYPHGAIPMTSVHGVPVFGGTFPALIWKTFMLDALAREPVIPFKLPRRELVTLEIDPKTGLLATDWCPGKKKTMLRQLAPTTFCPAPAPAPLPTAPVPIPTATTSKEKDRRASPTPSPTSSPSNSPTPEPSPTKDKNYNN